MKRLSKSSGQELEEFMNNVMVISKLQLQNLVRLLSYFSEGEEKMLIYTNTCQTKVWTHLFLVSTFKLPSFFSSQKKKNKKTKQNKTKTQKQKQKQNQNKTKKTSFLLGLLIE